MDRDGDCKTVVSSLKKKNSLLQTLTEMLTNMKVKDQTDQGKK